MPIRLLMDYIGVHNMIGIATIVVTGVNMTEEEFIETYCKFCGSQRCYGPGCEMAEGCSHYREQILHIEEPKKPLDPERLNRLKRLLTEAIKRHQREDSEDKWR